MFSESEHLRLTSLIQFGKVQCIVSSAYNDYNLKNEIALLSAGDSAVIELLGLMIWVQSYLILTRSWL